MQVLHAPLNVWDKDSIRPGPVGSVGDTNCAIRLRQSAPDMAMRFNPNFSGKNEEKAGSNISDGQWVGYTSHGLGARSVVKPMGYRRGFKTAVGWVFENVLPTDRSETTQMGSVGSYEWNSKVAQVYKAKASGTQFLPLPGGYTRTSLDQMGEIPRGSQIPVIAAESEGIGAILPAAAVKVTDPIYGEDGYIDEPPNPCAGKENYTWTPAMDDRRRNGLKTRYDIPTYPFRSAAAGNAKPKPSPFPGAPGTHDVLEYPPVGKDVTCQEWRGSFDGWVWTVKDFDPCGKHYRLDPPLPAGWPVGKRPKGPYNPGPIIPPKVGQPSRVSKKVVGR